MRRSQRFTTYFEFSPTRSSLNSASRKKKKKNNTKLKNLRTIQSSNDTLENYNQNTPRNLRATDLHTCYYADLHSSLEVKKRLHTQLGKSNRTKRKKEIQREKFSRKQQRSRQRSRGPEVQRSRERGEEIRATDRERRLIIKTKQRVRTDSREKEREVEINGRGRIGKSNHG